MHNLPLEALEPLNIRQPRHIQLSHRTHQVITTNRILLIKLGILAPQHLDLDLPFLALIIPPRLLHRRIKPNVPIQLVLVRHARQVA